MNQEDQENWTSHRLQTFPAKDMGTEPVLSSLKIFMFPWLAFGHISPFLQVAKKLSDRGFYIYLCSTAVNLDSIRKKITPEYSFSIQLVELHLPSLPELPPSLHTTNGLPSHLMSTLKNALYQAKPELSKILDSLKPHLVIHDAHQPWTAPLASRHNIPAMSFSTFNAATVSFFFHMFMVKPGTEFPFPAIHLSDIELARIREDVGSARAQAKEKGLDDEVSKGFSNGICLIRTSREIEGKYVDYLSELSNRKFVPVCPIILENHQQQQGDKDDDELIQWLGKRSERSSVFVSFGSEHFLNKQEMGELAFGLELSNVNFIWVLRFPKGEKMEIKEALPEGFLERVKDRGRIVEGWAPQAKILGHPSIGGFVSHCGWSSVLESIENGVPIIGMPMNFDQPFNARLVVEIGVGIEVVRDDSGRLKREEIAKGIRDVVMGKTGECLRTKSSDLNEKLKAKEVEEFDGFVEILKQLCHCPSSVVVKY